MSLINEALKRAQAEKDRSGHGPPYSPPPIGAAAPARLPRRWARALALACAAVAVAALGAWAMIDQNRWPPVPETASAAPGRATRGPLTRAPGPAATARKPKVRHEADRVPAKAIEEMAHHPPPADPPRRAGSPPADAGGAGLAGTTKPAPAPAPAGPRAKPAAKPSRRQPRLKLTGVLVGPGGGAAIINGRLVRTGDTIEGARVVEITKYVVTLELDGRRIALGL